MAKCKNCKHLYDNYDEDNVLIGKYCPKKIDYPDDEMERDCIFYETMTNADRIRARNDEELAEFLYNFDPEDYFGKESIMEMLQSESENRMEDEELRYCANCEHYELIEGVCCNGDSEHVADFRELDNTCEKWEEME